MAKVLYGSLITQLSGSIGGTVFARGANGNTVRRKSRNNNKNSISQSVFRNGFGSIQRSWRLLTTSDKSTWASGSSSFPYVNSLGVTSFYTGFQLFSKFNNQLFNVGVPRLDLCPTPSFISAITLPFSSFSTDTSFLYFNYHDSVSGLGVVPVGFVLQVFATGNLSLGVSSPKQSAFRMIHLYTEGETPLLVDIHAEYFKVFGVYPLPFANAFMSARYVSITTGEVGSFVRCPIVVV